VINFYEKSPFEKRPQAVYDSSSQKTIAQQHPQKQQNIMERNILDEISAKLDVCIYK
jgi:hypothetical protein